MRFNSHGLDGSYDDAILAVSNRQTYWVWQADLLSRV